MRISDPVWASQSVLADIRKQLRKMDPRLRVGWSHAKRKWAVCEVGRNTGHLSIVFYWDGPLDSAWDPIRRAVEECDMARYTSWREKDTELEASQAKRGEYYEAERQYMKKSVAQDYLERGVGVRQTFGPGGHRSRNFYKGGSRGALYDAACNIGRRA